MSSRNFRVVMPDAAELPVVGECCVVAFEDGEERRISIHDYPSVYEIPGLYERIYHDSLGCVSPEEVTSTLVDLLWRNQYTIPDERVLDVAAGNGLVGQELRSAGFRLVYGLDKYEEARLAAERERPDVYAQYLVGGIGELPPETLAILRESRLTGLTCVGSLGFGDLSMDSFARLARGLPDIRWIAVSVRVDLYEAGIAEALKNLAVSMGLKIMAAYRYRHRFALDGNPVYYLCVVAIESDECDA